MLYLKFPFVYPLQLRKVPHRLCTWSGLVVLQIASGKWQVAREGRRDIFLPIESEEAKGMLRSHYVLELELESSEIYI